MTFRTDDLRKEGALIPMESRINIAVCDDMHEDRTQIEIMTGEILASENIPCNITGYDSAKALLDGIHNGAQYNILLLDVMMDELNGIEFASILRAGEDNTDIIFISSNREMALCGYEVSAVRYLAKPLNEEKLKEALLHCYKKWKEKKEILIPTKQGLHRISVSDIQYVEAYDRGTRFVLDGEQMQCRFKMSEVETMLPETIFFQCHRGFIVNLTSIKGVRCYEFVLKNGHLVPIAKPRYNESYKKFVNYLAD